MPPRGWLSRIFRQAIDKWFPSEARRFDGAEWSRDRLASLVKERLAGVRVVVVANREPYIHNREGDQITWIRPASGLVTALDPIMRATGGIWVAHGSGSADRETSDDRGRLPVPPGKPSYTLRRIWLSKEEEDGYYYGFANRALWPLCHIAYTRPVFDAADWEQYARVNARFAEAVLDEIAGAPAIVLVQDYHFALLPRLVKTRRHDAIISHFWHIPWPHREAFRSRGAKLARRFGHESLAERWEAWADGYRRVILDRAYNRELGFFAQTLDGRFPDASNLLLATLGLIDPRDPRFVSTIDAYERLLVENGLMLRYRHKDDLGDTTSAFSICSFWWAEALAMIGRIDEAIAATFPRPTRTSV